jgi:hypothetical protein
MGSKNTKILKCRTCTRYRAVKNNRIFAAHAKVSIKGGALDFVDILCK